MNSSNDADPVVLYNTHNYDWIPYDGQFEVQKIKIIKNKLKIHTTALLDAEDSDFSLADNEEIQLPNASFTFSVLDVDKNHFKQLHAEFEQKKQVKDQLTNAEPFFGPVWQSSPCVQLECDSCYGGGGDDDYGWGDADRKIEIADDGVRSNACSLGRISSDAASANEPLEFIRGAMNGLFSGMYNCGDCPCGCSVPGYCD